MIGLRHLGAMPLLMAVVLTAIGTRAGAQNINEPEVEKGAQKLETFSVLQSGFHGGAAGNTRFVENLNYYIGLTDRWQVKAFAVLEKPTDDHLRATAAVIENTLEIVRAAKNGGIGLAWFTGLQAAIDRDETNSVIFGPIIRIGTSPISLILNPSLEKTFGQNDEEGIAFVYGWQVKKEVGKGIWLGVEGFGKFPDLGHGVPFEQQEHRVGPLVTLETSLAENRTLTWEFGALFGFTDATPDVASKLQITYSY